MKASGQTTRLIDQAIQELFNSGQLYLLRKAALNRNGSIIPKGNTLFVDPDHRMSNQAQNDFVYRVMKRLEFEHSGSHKIKTLAVDYVHIIVPK